jgi:hypothetical protein
MDLLAKHAQTRGERKGARGVPTPVKNRTSEASSKPLCKRKGAMEPFTFVAVLKSERTIAIDRAQELSAGSIVNSRCFSADIFQGKN